MSLTLTEGDLHGIVLLVHPKVLFLEILFNDISDVEPLLALVRTRICVHYTIIGQNVDELYKKLLDVPVTLKRGYIIRPMTPYAGNNSSGGQTYQDYVFYPGQNRWDRGQE